MIILIIMLFFMIMVQQLYISTERVYLFRTTVTAARSRLDHHLMVKSIIHLSKAWLKNKTLESMRQNHSLSPLELAVPLGQDWLSRLQVQGDQVQVDYKQSSDKDYKPLCVFAYTQEEWRVAKMLS